MTLWSWTSNLELSAELKRIDRRVSTGRILWLTGNSAARCWCHAGISSCWSSAFGTSRCLARGPTSMSSAPTSSGWGTHQRVYLTVTGAGAFVIDWTLGRNIFLLSSRPIQDPIFNIFLFIRQLLSDLKNIFLPFSRSIIERFAIRHSSMLLF